MQEDEIGTLTGIVNIPLSGAERIKSWSRHQKLQEDWLGTKVISISLCLLSLLQPGATRRHGTRIARGVPLPVYMNLDLYSGFWCTSRCVVF